MASDGTLGHTAASRRGSSGAQPGAKDFDTNIITDN